MVFQRLHHGKYLAATMVFQMDGALADAVLASEVTFA
jgi:hypothetical protein